MFVFDIICCTDITGYKLINLKESQAQCTEVHDRENGSIVGEIYQKIMYCL